MKAVEKEHNHSTNGLTKCCAIDVIEFVGPVLKKCSLGPAEIDLA